MGGACSPYEEMAGELGNAYAVLVGKAEVMSLLGRPRRRQEDNIRIDLREVRWEGKRLVVGSFEHGSEYSGVP
jgi:hypothetical protein